MIEVTPRVIHTGQAIVDIVMEISQVPEPGGDVFADTSAMMVGGGFNVMAAARREGAEVLYAGGHGTGPLGALVRHDLAQEGISTYLEVEPDSDTGFCVALIDDQAERTFISTRGAETRLPENALDELVVSSGDVIYVSGYSLHHPDNTAMLEHFLSRAKNAVVVVDASPVIADLEDHALDIAIRHAKIWTLNERESQLLLARLNPMTRSDGPRETAESLAQSLAATVLVRVGPEGCWLVGPEQKPVLVPGINVTPVDTNGAGDAHTGVLCAGICSGLTLLETVRRANVAAGIAVTRKGPATSPTTAEIDTALRHEGAL